MAKRGPKHNSGGATMASRLKMKARKVKNSKPELPRRGLSEERKNAPNIMAIASRVAAQSMTPVAKACSVATGRLTKN